MLQINLILPPTPPPTSSLKQGCPRLLGCGDVVPLWDFYFPRFKAVRGTHTKTCALFASSEVRTVSRMCPGQVRSVQFSLLGFLNQQIYWKMLQRRGLLLCSELPNSKFAVRTPHKYLDEDCCPFLYLLMLPSFLFLDSELFIHQKAVQQGRRQLR